MFGRILHSPTFVAGFLVLATVAPLPAADSDPARLVDPFLGTGGHGHTHPAATLPFGMVQLGPDTRLEGWDGCSGYHASDTALYGFSHTHLSGTGISDYGDILFRPVAGAARFTSDGTPPPPVGFDRTSERAEPGWYAVDLADGVRVQLTATERTGLHRYGFPAGRSAVVLVDLAHRDEVREAALRVVGDREIEGFRRSTGWARDQIVHFVARFSRPFTEVILLADSAAAALPGFAAGKDVKATLGFGDGGGEIVVRVGLSAVDADGARRNLETEGPGEDFETVRRDAREAWNTELRKIETEGGTAEQQVIFTTALYHSLLAPNVFSDVDGRYRGMDGAIHRLERGRRYTVFSLWDTFRATHPLFTLVARDRVLEFVETFLGQYREGGRLPVWELAANETDTMIGYHSVSVIADAWAQGIRGFDTDAALDAMVATATADRFGLDDYRRRGYLRCDEEPESVSKTLEYAYDDWCIARFAESLGRADVAAEFHRRAQAWRHLLDPDTGFFRARRNGRFLEPFDPTRVDLNYTEANAWQYAFFVPHDVEGLVAALGGEESFVARLDSLFAADTLTTGRDQADITGLLGQYAHGNEPSHHMAWLYHYAGRPDASAPRVREILERFYTTGREGLCGNEDCGQMSSWYVLAAIGLYPVCPGSGEWLLGAPLFDRVTLHLDGGRDFTIRAEGASRPRPAIVSARLDGRPLTRSFLRREDLAAGGTLQLVLGDAPGPWGTRPADRPTSRGGGARVLAAPFARAAGDRFRDSLVVALDCTEPGATISWVRVDEDTDESRGAWRPYEAPIVLHQTASLRFVAERDGARSPAVDATFRRITKDWAVQWVSPPAPQYSADGIESLLDDERGSEEWRTGRWLGWQGEDFDIRVDFGAPRTVHRVGAGFLQDIRSWIWLPAEIVVSVSDDGRRYREVARVPADLSDRDEEVRRHDLVATLDGRDVRWVRLQARSYGTIPWWHPGGGKDAWIFVDELLVE